MLKKDSFVKILPMGELWIWKSEFKGRGILGSTAFFIMGSGGSSCCCGGGRFEKAFIVGFCGFGRLGVVNF